MLEERGRVTLRGHISPRPRHRGRTGLVVPSQLPEDQSARKHWLSLRIFHLDLSEIRNLSWALERDRLPFEVQVAIKRDRPAGWDADPRGTVIDAHLTKVAHVRSQGESLPEVWVL